MNHVVIEKLCGCAKKQGIKQIQSFDTKEEAEEYANEWAETLNDTFCGKHGFDVVEVDGNFVISVENATFIESCDI